MPRNQLIMERIPIAGPSITQLEIDYATDAAAHGWYDRAHEYPHRFEQAFASYIGVKHAVSLPSCTSGSLAKVSPKSRVEYRRRRI